MKCPANCQPRFWHNDSLPIPGSSKSCTNSCVKPYLSKPDSFRRQSGEAQKVGFTFSTKGLRTQQEMCLWKTFLEDSSSRTRNWWDTGRTRATDCFLS